MNFYLGPTFFVISLCSPRNYTLFRVYVSSISQDGGTHSQQVPPAMRPEKHTPETRCSFSCTCCTTQNTVQCTLHTDCRLCGQDCTVRTTLHSLPIGHNTQHITTGPPHTIIYHFFFFFFFLMYTLLLYQLLYIIKLI